MWAKVGQTHRRVWAVSWTTAILHSADCTGAEQLQVSGLVSANGFRSSDEPQSYRHMRWFAPRSSPSAQKLGQCPLANDTALITCYSRIPPYPKEQALPQVPTLRPMYLLVIMQMNTKHWCDVLKGGHGVLGEMPLFPTQILQGPGCNRTWVSALTAGDIGLIVDTANCNIKLDRTITVRSYRTVNTTWTLTIRTG